MVENREVACPECESVDRRGFLRFLGIGTATVATGGSLLPAVARAEEGIPAPRVRKPRLAEDLVKELFAGMTVDQKKRVSRPFEDKARLSVNPNAALQGQTIATTFDAKQVELLDRIVRAMAGSEEGYRQISRAGTWDASRTFTNCGAHIFGDPTKGPFAFLFTGHHLTLRVDGDSAEGAAFGGPIYYGHTPDPYSEKNVFYYQTKQAMKFFDALDAKQREKSIAKWGAKDAREGEGSIRIRSKTETKPGIAASELTGDQKELMLEVMRSITYPFRPEDADEVMSVVKATGGLEKVHFAFYKDRSEGEDTDVKKPWSFWRLEGPGIVWNFRVLPHVHTFVNITSKV